jgi:general secretion pathway protein G
LDYSKNNYLFRSLKKNSKGFTLIELIVVVGIISILSVAAVAMLDPLAQFQKSNDTRRKSDLAQIQRALEVYYGDNGMYPANATGACATHYQIAGNSGGCVEWGASWQPFMNIMPKDPRSGWYYVYKTTSTRQSYYLYASLERGAKDPQACNSGLACTSLTTLSIPSNACGGICNFGVSSPNVSP